MRKHLETIEQDILRHDPRIAIRIPCCRDPYVRIALAAVLEDSCIAHGLRDDGCRNWFPVRRDAMRPCDEF